MLLKTNIGKDFKKEELVFIPLGGVGEIGMNCYLYHFEDNWIMIDLGVTFKDEKVKNADLILPDIEYITKKKDKLKAIILTHAHEDHIGAMPYLYNRLNDVPIYTTAFTASVLKKKFLRTASKDKQINLFEYNKRLKIGPFDIEVVALTHSIPEPNALVIRTKKGNIFHTGDWKIDPKPLVGNAIDEMKIKQISNDGIHVMVCDSTNVFNEKPSGSENDVRESLKKIFAEKKNGKIIITCFASNIARLETIGFVAKKYNRTCVLVGRSLRKMYESALENNYLNDLDSFISEKDGKNLPDENIVLICTGSQGESRAALYKLVYGNNLNFEVNLNDLVIFSSREIPGNESQINDLKNKLLKIGCHFKDHKNSMVHVSGHPSKSELKKMYEWIKPDLIIPVHGEYQHLAEHAKFAVDSGISSSILVENGDVIVIDKQGQSKKIFSVQTGRKVLKGSRILPADKKVFSNTNTINTEGDLLVIIVLDKDDNILSDPLIFSQTFLDEDDKIEKEEIIDEINSHLNNDFTNFVNDSFIEDFLKKKIRSFTKKKFGIKPITNIKVIRV